MTQHPAHSDDPLHEYSRYETILAYRMSVLETTVSGIGNQLEHFIAQYPTRELLDLLLSPLRNDIKELKVALETKEAEKRQLNNQLKIMVISVVASPIVSALVAAFVAGVIK